MDHPDQVQNDRFRRIFVAQHLGSSDTATDVINEGPIDPTSIDYVILTIPRHVPQQQNFTHVVLHYRRQTPLHFCPIWGENGHLEAIDADDNEHQCHVQCRIPNRTKNRPLTTRKESAR